MSRTSLKLFARRLARATGGNVLPLVAAGTLVLVGLVGGGVDMARAYKAQRHLQAACDAGVLAGRRSVTTNGFDTAALTQAREYFTANYDNGEQGTTSPAFNPTSDDNGNTVVGTASATLSTIIMKVFGIATVPVSASCTASMGIGNSDVTFVLDNTGSMDWTPDGDFTSDTTATRIYALKQAMKAFYATVADSNNGSNARIRYAFVPYSSTVNVGQLLMALDSSYVANSMTISSRRPVNWSGVVDSWTDTGSPTNPEYGDFSRQGSRYSSKTSCESNKPSDDTSWSTYDTDTSTSTYFDSSRGASGQKVTATGTQQNQAKSDYECLYYDGNRWTSAGYYVYRRYITRQITSYTYQARDPVTVTTSGATFQDWLYGPTTIDVSGYKTGSAQLLVSSRSGETRFNSSSSWPGCIQERDTTPATSFSFGSLATGITPVAALDLDIDSAPTSDATRWKPLWASATFRRSGPAPSLSGDSSSASSACPYRAQLLTEMSEGDFGAYVDALRADGGTYHDIGLLWGARLSSTTGIFASNVNEEPGNGGTVSRHMIFMTDGELDPDLSTNGAYGIEKDDRRITTDGGGGTQYDNHRARWLAICEAIKARGIRLWVIAFGTDLTSDLQTCGSPDSSFEADDADELNQHFQEIAKQVGELRIVQ
jgi:Flp pilus assembly protein TadG